MRQTIRQGITYRTDPQAEQEAALSSLVRACISVGLSKFDRNTTASDIARKTWADRSVDLILRAAVSPSTLSNTPTLATIAVAFLESLTPVSAGADLLRRGIGLNFNGAAQI